MMITIAGALALAAHTPTIADVKALVSAELKDPRSAQFSGIKLRKNGETGKVDHFCGYVNAKNSYGGYAGKSYFIGDFEGKIVILDPDLSEPNLC